MKLKLLKFDSVHPAARLEEQQASAGEAIRKMDYPEYYRWLMGRRNNLSDYLTHPMNEAGWEARELVPVDDLLLTKLEEAGESPQGSVGRRIFRHAAGLSLGQIARLQWAHGYANRKREERIRNYLEAYRPDVIFIREPSHMDGRFFDAFRERCLVVGMIACQTNHAWNWDAHRHDLIFTFTEEYRRFFEAQGIPSRILQLGVDERVIREVGDLPKTHEVTFVGYLGQPHQKMKTELFARVAQEVKLRWWGPKGEEIGRYPALAAAWQGMTGGLEMLKIYRQSKIVLNDYPDFMQGQSNNMRNMEAFSVGSFLLTRHAENIAGLEKEGALATFRDAGECVSKVRYFLEKEEERERIAKKGAEVARERFNYRTIVRGMMEAMEEAYESKKPRMKGWDVVR